MDSVTLYRVYGTDHPRSSPNHIADTTANSFLVPNASGVWYNYFVVSVDISGNEGPISDYPTEHQSRPLTLFYLAQEWKSGIALETDLDFDFDCDANDLLEIIRYWRAF